jgi:hypothetical protein|tara:strand:- start:615 stop:1223 length:609 start_codon:yes stop_codon:yes gene_type:complete
MIRVNKSKQELENDIRIRRDSLQTLHQRLKKTSDNFQLWIMGISTLSGSIEVTKLTLGLNDPALDLTSIFMASVTTLIASFMRFKDLPSRMEILVKASSDLTNVLKSIRDAPQISVEMVEAYNECLAVVERSLYPDQRKEFFAIANRGVLSITKSELEFKKKLHTINEKHALKTTDIEAGKSNEIVTYGASAEDDDDDQSIQ